MKEKALAVIGQEVNVFLAARNSTEMAQSQERLISWLSSKCESLQKEIEEIQHGIEHAKTHKWATQSLRGALIRTKSRLTYYDKLLKATEAGFVIIPWQGFDSFAVRVVREEAKLLSSNESEYSKPPIPDQPSDNAPAGEGRYVNTASAGMHYEGTKKNRDGKDVKVWWSESTDFREIDFPFLAAKPVLMNATANAMALKIFDEIGIAPNRRGKDPLILGVVKGCAGKQNQHFLIAWYLDTRAL